MRFQEKAVGWRVLDLRDPSLLDVKAYVAGARIDAQDDMTIAVTDPFDGALIAEVPDLGPDMARRAIDKAHEVQKEWAARTVNEVSQVLERWIRPDWPYLSTSRTWRGSSGWPRPWRAAWSA
jgi:succinate-semialdehyde dehydrogenase/glutarate-semialdehyde dehydrogenase